MKNAIIASMFFASSFLPLAGAAAQEEDESDCGGAGTTVEINACAEREFSEADQQLNAVYRSIMESIVKDEAALAGKKDAGIEQEYLANKRDTLVKAERAWIAFRDAECEAAAFDSEGGTIHSFEVEACRTRMTRERTKDLSGLYLKDGK